MVLAGGILHKAKLPGIPGIEDFEGKAFHTSRWDYGYTGGSPTEPMDHLADKRVGIIGTGATAVQVVPQIARVAKEVYVFQRTPGAVGVRNQQPTDVEWFQSLEPGWQKERIVNFTQAVTGAQPEVDLVHDGWTEVMWVDTQRAPDSEEEVEALERSDFETMEAIRRRVDEIVQDPETAEKLKPYWGKHCKRVCFHDDYLTGVQPAQRASGGHRWTWCRRTHRSGARGERCRVPGGSAHLRLRLRGHDRSAPTTRLRPKGPRRSRPLGAVGRGRPHAARGAWPAGSPTCS